MKRILCVSAFLVMLGIGNAITCSVHAQSNAELLEMMQAMRQQINAQQKQLEAMEKELKRRSEIASTPEKRSEAESASPATETARGIGDSYIGAFVGGAFMLDTDTTLTRFFPGGPFVNKGKDVVVESSPLVGAKGGLCPAFFSYLCMELAVDYFKPSVDEQFVKGITIGPSATSPGAFVPNLQFGVWSLGLNALGRIGLLPKSDYPLGRQLHFYAGGGPSFIWTSVKDGSSPNGGTRDTDFAVGVEALGGVKYFVSKNVAVFGEYKFRHWRAGAFSLGSDRIDSTSFNANLFYLGLSLHP